MNMNREQVENEVRYRQAPGRGEKWARRLKLWGGAMSGLFSMLFYLFFLSMFLGGGSLLGGGKAEPAKKLYGAGEDKIAVVDITGIILEEDVGGNFGLGGGSVTTFRSLVSVLEDVKKDEKIRALVLRINSPGGSVTASEEIFQLIERFKKESGLPIIVSQGDTAASGGYYVSLAGDVIIANETTLTGSIGAIVQAVNFKDLADKLGVEGVVIASGENKDMLNPFEEVKDKDRQILQKIVDQARDQFAERIIENRDIKEEELRRIADGRVLSGEQAKQNGLIDRLGNFNDAVELAKEKAGLTEATVVVFGKKGFLESLLGSFSAGLNPTANVPFVNLWALNARPAYLYLP